MSERQREQPDDDRSRQPDAVIACVGGGSNSIGFFHAFLNDDVKMIGVEAVVDKDLAAVVLAVVLALPTITLGKEKGTGATADEATLKKIEQELTDTIVKSDTSAFEKYLASDYLGIGPDGVTQNKSELLADIKSGTLKLESSTLSDMKVQVAAPDMAVVVYRSDDKGTYKGKDITGQYRWLDVFVKRDGKWQIAIDQGTPIAKQ